MGFLTTLLTGFALSMDAFAVSVTKGMTLRKINILISLKIAFLFGLFQGLMPLLGWFAGIRFQSYITAVDHWIALFLLSFIGLKMIFQAYEDIKNPELPVLIFVGDEAYTGEYGYNQADASNGEIENLTIELGSRGESQISLSIDELVEGGKYILRNYHFETNVEYIGEANINGLTLWIFKGDKGYISKGVEDINNGHFKILKDEE